MPVHPAVAKIIREATIPKEGQDFIVNYVNGKKGIHYRPHRTDPKNFVVVKIYHSIKGSRKMLENFLKGLGGKFQIQKGSVKWVAIAPREKVEKAAKEAQKAKQKQQAKAQTMTWAQKKAKEKEKAQAKSKWHVTPTLGQEQEKEKVYQTVGGGTTTMGGGGGGGLSWSPGKWSLDHVEGPEELAKLYADAVAQDLENVALEMYEPDPGAAKRFKAHIQKAAITRPNVAETLKHIQNAMDEMDFIAVSNAIGHMLQSSAAELQREPGEGERKSWRKNLLQAKKATSVRAAMQALGRAMDSMDFMVISNAIDQALAEDTDASGSPLAETEQLKGTKALKALKARKDVRDPEAVAGYLRHYRQKRKPRKGKKRTGQIGTPWTGKSKHKVKKESSDLLERARALIEAPGGDFGEPAPGAEKEFWSELKAASLLRVKVGVALKHIQNAMDAMDFIGISNMIGRLLHDADQDLLQSAPSDGGLKGWRKALVKAKSAKSVRDAMRALQAAMDEMDFIAVSNAFPAF